MTNRRIPFSVRYAKHLLSGKAGSFAVGVTALSFALLTLILFWVNIRKTGQTDIRVYFENAGGFEELTETVSGVFFTDNLPVDTVSDRFSSKDTEVFTDTSFSEETVSPLSGRITSCFGYRISPFEDKITLHAGVDIAAAEGTDVCCIADGTVTAVGYGEKSGNYVIVDHGNLYVSTYCHLQKATVKKGQTVSAGDTIGTVGQTGQATGPHLHLKVAYNGTAVDPCLYIDLDE